MFDRNETRRDHAQDRLVGHHHAADSAGAGLCFRQASEMIAPP